MNENDKHPIADWKYEVENGDTWLGYEQWLQQKLESDADDLAHEAAQMPESISTDGSIAVESYPPAMGGDLEIKRWIRCPDACDETTETTDELLETAGRLLDKAYSHDIVGECLFEGADGKFYVGTVKFMIGEANPDYVKEAIAEMEEEAKAMDAADFSGFNKGVEGDQEL